MCTVCGNQRDEGIRQYFFITQITSYLDLFLTHDGCTILNSPRNYNVKRLSHCNTTERCWPTYENKINNPPPKKYTSHASLRFKYSAHGFVGDVGVRGRCEAVGRRKMAPRQTTFPEEPERRRTASGSSFCEVWIVFLLHNKRISAPVSGNLMVRFQKQATRRTRSRWQRSDSASTRNCSAS